MSILSLRDISGAVVFKNNLIQKAPNSSYNIILFQSWEAIKAANLMPTKIKNEITRIEKEVLEKSQCDNGDKAIELLIQNVDQLFRALCLNCNTKEFFGEVIPTTDILYLHLGQIWADEALSVLWEEIGKQLRQQQPPIVLPALKELQEKKTWLENPDNAQKLAKVTRLDLSGKNLKIFPLEIKFCTGLQQLNLSKNQIAEVPPDLKLPLLQALYLSDNQLVALPALNLPSLQTLSLDNNQLVDLPVLNLPSLQQLSISNNQLVDLPALNLPLLQVLSLDNNQLVDLPAFNLPLLLVLSLNNNQLVALPALNLLSLEELSLNNNRLVDLPAFNLPLLKRLHLSNNQLVDLPALNLPSLLVLSLNNNQLVALPALNLPSLQKLSLSNNQLLALPDLNLSKLSVLDLDGNMLLFISDKDRNNLSKDYCISSLKQFEVYNCNSKLSQFFQLNAVHKKLYLESAKILFNDLERKDKELVYEMLYKVSGVTSTDPSWGENHTFENMHLFHQAIRKAISVKFDRLSEQDKNRVYGKIYELASPTTQDKKWGEHHAFEHVLRLIDAMASI